ncbi:MFS transporter (plasmid) [Rhizobium sp. CB3060]|nr:MFS transporter [Rhizobium tropici]UWU24499.1 MFS transporter [Rhizobium tropici]
MARPHLKALLPFLLLLFVGTVCNAMIAPFMGFFIVEGLKQPPWTISIYAGALSCLAIAINRQFAGRIDRGKNAFPLIGIALAGYLSANLSLSIIPSLWTVLTFGVIGFGVSTSAVSTMFSLGGGLAAKHQIENRRLNAFMRATTSTAWMVGPAVSFLVADQFGKAAVFRCCVLLGLVWLALWWCVKPQNATAKPKESVPENREGGNANPGLWLAATFVFCLSSAHSLTFSTLPLFYVQEVGLPGYAPGTAFTVKTFVEVFAIFSTPLLMARFGIRKPLMATTLLAVVAIQVLASVQTFPQMVAGAAMEGLYYGLYASLGISFVQSYAEGRPARATAIYWNTLMISGVLAGPAVGIIAQAYGFRTVLHVASLVALFAAVVLLFGARQSRVLTASEP